MDVEDNAGCRAIVARHSRFDGRAQRIERSLTGIALVLLSGSAIAVVPTAAELAFESGSNPLTILTLRSIVGVALMALVMAASGQPFSMTRRAFAPCFYAGLAHAVVAYGFIGSVAHMPVSLVVLVYATHPVLLAVISRWQGNERLTVWKLALAFTVLAALAVVLSAGFNKFDVTGIALGTLASVAVCGMILLCACAQSHATSTQVNFYMMAMAAVLFAAATTVGGSWSLPSGTMGWLGLAGVGLGVSVGLLAFLAALRFIGVVRATIVSNVEPVFGILFAAVVLGERLDGMQCIGVALIVMALVLFELPPRQRTGPRRPAHAAQNS